MLPVRAIHTKQIECISAVARHRKYGSVFGSHSIGRVCMFVVGGGAPECAPGLHTVYSFTQHRQAGTGMPSSGRYSVAATESEKMVENYMFKTNRNISKQQEKSLSFHNFLTSS